MNLSEALKQPFTCCFILLVIFTPWIAYFHEHSQTTQELDDIISLSQKIRRRFTDPLSEENLPDGNVHLNNDVDQKFHLNNDVETFDILTYSCSRKKRCPEVAKMAASLRHFSSKIKIHFHVIYDDVCEEEIKKLESSKGFQISLWEYKKIRRNVLVKRPHIPVFIEANKFHGSSCHLFRLFMLDVEPFLSIKKILTIDSDTLVVSDIGKYLSDVWSKLDDKSIAIAPEAMSKDGPGDSYYTDGQHDNVLDKFIGDTGGNAGVLFLNYEILRQKNFIDSLYTEISTCLHHQPPCDLNLAEQDMLNFYFSSRMDEVIILPCVWNYRMNYKNQCCDHPLIMHGSNFVFYKDMTLEWKTLWNIPNADDREEQVMKISQCETES